MYNKGVSGIDEVVRQAKKDLRADRLWVFRTVTAMVIVAILTCILMIIK